MLDLKEWISKVTNCINPANTFVIEEYTPMGTSVTLPGSGTKHKEGYYTVTKAGYYPVCLAGYYIGWISGANINVNVYRYRFTAQSVGSATLSLGIGNTGTSSATVKPQFFVLWAKVAQ